MANGDLDGESCLYRKDLGCDGSCVDLDDRYDSAQCSDICSKYHCICNGEKNISLDTLLKDVFFGDEQDGDEEINTSSISDALNLSQYAISSASEDVNGLSDYINGVSDGSKRRNEEYIKSSTSTASYWRIILEPDKDGDNLIFVSIILGMSVLCKKFLDLIPNQDVIQKRANKMFQTALHLAVLTDNALLARRILVAGVELDRQDKHGNTALHIACKRMNSAVASELLKSVTPSEAKQNAYKICYPKVPQNLEIRNYEGQTCFMIAAINGDTAMMDLLVSKHANINVKDIKSGMTCLHILTEMGNITTVRHLLAMKNVDINAKTYSSFTALDIANIRGQSKIAYLLLCAGAAPKLRPKDSTDFLAESDSDENDD